MAIEKTIKIKLDSNVKDATKDVEALKQEFEGVADSAETASDATSEMSSTLDGATGGKIAAFNGMKKSVIAVAKGFFTLRGAIIASGIGALVLAIVAVTQAFKGSEEGQNKFAKIMYGMGVIMDNILDLLADLGEAIIYAFENPIETLKSFGKAIIDNIVNRFMGMLELIPAIGSAISELFSGNFSKAGRIAANAMGKVVYGIENVVEKTEAAILASQKFIEQQKAELVIANQISAARAFADVLERKLLVSRAKLQTQIAKLKLKSREEETVSAEDRKQALLDAQALEDGLLKKELEVAQLRFDSIRKENTLARSTKEAKLAEAQAEADLFNIIAKRTDAQRATQRELNRVNKEIAAATKARQKVEEKALIYGVQFTEQMSNEEIEVLTKAAEEKYKIIVKEGQDRIKLQENQDKLRLDLMEEGFDKEVAKLVAKSEAQLLIAQNDKDLQLAIEKDFQAKIIALGKKSAVESEKTNKAARDKEIAGNKAVQDSKVQMANDAFGAISGLVTAFAGESEKSQKRAFKINKAISIAQAIINTAGAISGAINPAVGGLALPAGLPGLALAAATGIAQVATIAKTEFNSTDAGIEPPPTSIAEAQAPSFNVVGDSGVNQLAQLQQQPTQAYVVSGEVTSAQALDRNRVQNATL